MISYMTAWYGNDAGYGKPGSQNYTMRNHWYPTMNALYFKNDSSNNGGLNLCSIIAQVTFDDTPHTMIGAPKHVFINITLLSQFCVYIHLFCLFFIYFFGSFKNINKHLKQWKNNKRTHTHI